jgi:phage baseplate assembly protein W|tara:strand:+ start:734 stop:1159 length:426 start_codon:yes stop_codon:yes gene_type:complete
MASARENDLNPNVYIGLALPIKPDDNNIFSLTKNSFDQVRHNLRNLLLTNVGERVYQPEFGSRLRELCFEQLDESLPQRVEDEVRRAVNFWLPYVNIVEVETLTQEDNKSKIFVRVKFSTTLNSDTLQQIELDASYTAERL